MPSKTPRLDEWRQAEHAANVAAVELRNILASPALSEAGLRFAEQAVLTKDLRARAHELFTQAMKEMENLARSLR